ncbi:MULTISPECIES: GFA family protein [Arsenophonus]|uniref:GFA family protein n=1 Tax=Arsenophonus TaxID=637 RepID=UPI0015D8E6C9|nr:MULTISPECIES: GFA family protein [Arsenophonus]UBX30264.1 GFA family protein [Arsenophonus apicola]
MQYEGQCLHGHVILKTEQPWYAITACHCKMCQKCNGEQLMSFIIENGLSIKDKSTVSHSRSSAWLIRTFYNKCTTHLFFKIYEPESHGINAALFEQNQIGFLVTQFYIGCKYMYYNLIEQKSLFAQQHILNT